MDSAILTDVLRLAIPPTAVAVVGAVIRQVVSLYRARAASDVAHPEIVLPAGARLPPRSRSGRSLRVGSFLARLRRVGGALGRVAARLPPLRRRTNPWRATLVGGFFMGFGIAGYFRTWVDALVGGVLTVPFVIAAGYMPTESASSTAASAEPASPTWAKVVLYGTMAVTAAYSYARARSSNRSLETYIRAGAGRRSDSERREILAREVDLLASGGWRVESIGDFDAVVSRMARPNHVLHVILTFLTVYVWGIVWLGRTISARRNPTLEHRLVSVDLWGSAHVERLPR